MFGGQNRTHSAVARQPSAAAGIVLHKKIAAPLTQQRGWHRKAFVTRHCRDVQTEIYFFISAGVDLTVLRIFSGRFSARCTSLPAPSPVKGGAL
jgi:hypothetical protein